MKSDKKEISIDGIEFQ